MDVCLLSLYVALSCVGRGLCDGLITCPEESYRVSLCVWSRNPEREAKGPSLTISACEWISQLKTFRMLYNAYSALRVTSSSRGKDSLRICSTAKLHSPETNKTTERVKHLLAYSQVGTLYFYVVWYFLNADTWKIWSAVLCFKC
jgi:hypothetical protein